LILRGEHALQVGHRQRAIIEDGLADQALGVGCGQTGLHYDERKSRRQEHFKFAARILRHGRATHTAKNAAEPAAVPCHAVTFF
jgi:hypothetical protein